MPVAPTGDFSVGRGRHGPLAGGGLGVGGAVLFGGAVAEGDARDGGQVGRGALGERRVAHLQQEVALVHDAGACGEEGRKEISLCPYLSSVNKGESIIFQFCPTFLASCLHPDTIQGRCQIRETMLRLI